MALQTCAVTCVMHGQDGQPEAGATFEAKLNRFEIYQGYVVPEVVRGTADENGVCILDLWPNQLGATESLYDVKMRSTTGRSLTVQAVVPSELTANLHEISLLPPFPGKLDGQVQLESAIEASQVALASRDATIVARDATLVAATDADADRASAEAAAATATTQAGIATTKATEAAGHEAASLASKNAAELAMDKAQASKVDAESARDAAQTAKGDAEAAASTATSQATAAGVHAASADADRIAAESARTAAESARNDALSYKGSAEAAATTAAAQAGVATTKAGEASASAALAAAHAASIDPSQFLKKYATGVALPTSDIGPIWHDDYADIMTWRTIGSYTGYASVSLGAVEYFDASTPPPGWLESAGQTVSSAYEALIAFRGSATLRDLRGEFVRGWDHGRGVDAGRVFGSAQADEFKSHTHAANNQNTTVYAVPNGAFYGLIGNDLGATRPTGATGSTETRPRNVALLPCIKF